LDYSGNNESLSAARQIAGIGVAPWSTHPRGKIIRYSTVRKFKGLEAPAVIIYNINGSIDNPDPLFYVATTRAKSNLTLIGDMESIISISETMGS
jgi:superfamily I DNA/RNA helicase